MATSYSRLALLQSRVLSHILEKLEVVWLNTNGYCKEISGDLEFKAADAWFEKRGIKFIPLPARRHNKAGIVERKNRVIKDILARLQADPLQSRTSMESRVSLAEFISNLMYGNQVASAFEMARGYTPALAGISQVPLPNAIWIAQKELSTRRMLQRTLRSRPASTIPPLHVDVGETVLVLVPGGARKRGEWIEAVIDKVTDKGDVICGHGRNRSHIAREDVRKLPISVLARNVVRAEAGVPLRAGITANDGDGEASSEEDNEGTADRELRHEEAFSQELGENQEGVSSTSNENSKSNTVSVPKISLTYVPAAFHDDGDQSDQRSSTSLAQDVEMEMDRNVTLDIGTETADPNHSIETDVVRSSTRLRQETDRYTPEAFSKMSNPLDASVTRQVCLQRVYNRLGSSQFTKREVGEIPRWIFDESHAEEIQKNWVENKKDVPFNQVPHDANIIGSHIIYKVKPDEEDPKEQLKLKSRICAHGNKDDERESLRTDSAVASHFAFGLIYSIAVAFDLMLGKVHIRGAYTQSGTAQRDVYVRPPYELGIWNTLWLLTTTIYGIISAGRKWQRASDFALISNLGLSLVLGIHQLFFYKAQMLNLILAKYVDDILIAAKNKSWLDWTVGGIQKSFEVGSFSCFPQALSVNSRVVEQDHDSIEFSMLRYQKNELELFSISPPRRKQVDAILSSTEMKSVLRMAGKLNYLGTCVSPFAAFASSYIQQTLPNMRISGLKFCNGIIREVVRHSARIVYLKPSHIERSRAVIVSFSDAGFCHPTDKKRAQEGVVYGIAYGLRKGCIFHTVGFVSRAQRRR